jgi:hypothetical protein
MNWLKTLTGRIWPKQTFERGWNCADKCILAGEDPAVLRGQACSDLNPDDFTKGWKERCDVSIRGKP